MTRTAFALAAFLALGTAAAASAQPAPQPGPVAGPNAGPATRQWQRPDPAQMAERHAQRLRDALQLRPDQEPALRAFLAAAHPPRDPNARRGERAQRQALTTPQRLDQMAARMAERQARFQQTAAATKRFYAQLSPAQQKAFDAQHFGRGGHERGGKDHAGKGRGGHDGHRGGGFGGRMG